MSQFDSLSQKWVIETHFWISESTWLNVGIFGTRTRQEQESNCLIFFSVGTYILGIGFRYQDYSY